MVNFGKKLMADQIPEWKGYYINYKLMKKKVKQYGQQVQQGEKDRRRVLKDFSKMLDDQVMPRDRCYEKPLLHSP
jgi:SPX domain protein involved in polyphosphate accumulation